MKLAVAQTRPCVGDVARNLSSHVDLARRAAASGADLIAFPELSLTGYEPALAAKLAASPRDSRFDVLQEASDVQRITIAAGMPTRHADGVKISMLVFQPQQARAIYSKQHLHADELPFFSRGQGQVVLRVGDLVVVPAICFESLQPEHARQARGMGAEVYLASVAKAGAGVDSAHSHFAEISRRHGMYVLMANCLGVADGMLCTGGSACWNSSGSRLGQLNAKDEGLLLLDTESEVAAAVAG